MIDRRRKATTSHVVLASTAFLGFFAGVVLTMYMGIDQCVCNIHSSPLFNNYVEEAVQRRMLELQKDQSQLQSQQQSQSQSQKQSFVSPKGSESESANSSAGGRSCVIRLCYYVVHCVKHVPSFFWRL